MFILACFICVLGKVVLGLWPCLIYFLVDVVIPWSSEPASSMCWTLHITVISSSMFGIWQYISESKKYLQEIFGMVFCFTYWPGHFWVIGVLLQHKCCHRKLILCIDIGSIWCYWLADLRVWNALPVCWSSWCCQLFLPYHNVCGPWWCTVCKFLTCIHIHIHRLYSCFNSITFLVCLMLGKYLMGFLVYIKMTTLMQQMAWHHWANRTFAVIRFNCAGAFTVMRICVGRSESYW